MLKTTLPVGVPPGPVTVAVKVTDWPSSRGCGRASATALVWADVLDQGGAASRVDRVAVYLG